MLKRKHIQALLSILLFSLGSVLAEENEVDLESDLRSWNELKRDAGYYTERGTYRGGLWKNMRVTDNEEYLCLDNNVTHCTEWSTYEISPIKRETGTCTCAETATPFCTRWNCESEHIHINGKCTSTGAGPGGSRKTCEDVYLADTLECECIFPSENGRYCHLWNCVDESSNGYAERERYECLVASESGDYCARWKGAVSSRKEIEASICACVEGNDRFCEYWRCAEREIRRCASARSAWCNLAFAIAFGGIIGSGIILIAALVYHVTELYEVPDNKHWSFYVAVLSLPWMIGVVIFGGTAAVLWVFFIWGTVGSTLFLLCSRYHANTDESD